MARPGRKAHTEPRTRWEVEVPTTLAAKIEIICADPVTGRSVYGARKEFIVTALENELARRQTSATSADDVFRSEDPA